MGLTRENLKADNRGRIPINKRLGEEYGIMEKFSNGIRFCSKSRQVKCKDS